MTAPFEVRNVWKRFGATEALRGVTTSFVKGLNVVVGPNGSGKTTLLKILVGLAKPSSGKVISLGLDPSRDAPKVLRLVGLFIEGYQLPWWLSGESLARILSYERGVKWSLVKELAEELGVSSYWKRVVRGYSSGMRKRLELLLAFACAREALVLDEPFTLLDKASVKIVSDLIERFAKNVPVVVATHVEAPCVDSADKEVILIGGEIAKEVRRDEVPNYVCRVRDAEAFLRSVAIAREGIEKLELQGDVALLKVRDPRAINALNGIESCTPSMRGALSYEELVS